MSARGYPVDAECLANLCGMAADLNQRLSGLFAPGSFATTPCRRALSHGELRDLHTIFALLRRLQTHGVAPGVAQASAEGLANLRDLERRNGEATARRRAMDDRRELACLTAIGDGLVADLAAAPALEGV